MADDNVIPLNVSRGTPAPAPEMVLWVWVGADSQGQQVFQRGGAYPAKMWLSRDVIKAAGKLTDEFLDQAFQALSIGVQ